MLRDWIISHLPDYVLVAIQTVNIIIGWISLYILLPAFVVVLLIIYLACLKASPVKTIVYSLAFIGFSVVTSVVGVLLIRFYGIYVDPVYSKFVYDPFMDFIYSPYMEHIYSPYMKHIFNPYLQPILTLLGFVVVLLIFILPLVAGYSIEFVSDFWKKIRGKISVKADK